MGPAATEDHAPRRGGRRLTRRATHRRRCPGRRRSGATVHAGPRAPSGPAAGIAVLNGRRGRRRLRQGQQPPLPGGGVPGARRTTPSVGAFDRRRIPECADPPRMRGRRKPADYKSCYQTTKHSGTRTQTFLYIGHKNILTGVYLLLLPYISVCINMLLNQHQCIYFISIYL